MFNSGRDEDAELTGCGFGACFCADISLLTVAAVRSFAGKVERFNVHYLHYLPFRDLNEPKQFFLVRFRTPRFLFPGVIFYLGQSERPRAPAAGNGNNPEVVGRVQLQLSMSCVNGALLPHSRVLVFI